MTGNLAPEPRLKHFDDDDFSQTFPTFQFIRKEFPAICINNYNKDVRDYLDKRKYHGYLTMLPL